MRGKRVALLETRLGPQMADLITRRGGVPVPAPALAELPDLDPDRIAALVASFASEPPGLVIFQTGVGTQALFAATDALGITDRLLAALAKAVVAVRGPKPTGALRGRGVRVDLSAAEPFTTAELMTAVAAVPLARARVVVQRYGVTNAELDAALTAKGAKIVEIPTYRWSLPADTAPLTALMDALDRGEIDAVAVTNAAQVYNLFALAEKDRREQALCAGLSRTLVASVGPVVSATLRKFGVAIGLEASPPKMGPLIAALDAALKDS
ncbi:MAG: uroporphyrinogen-III synthase [Alphaproteobacteria bacterium]|nr:uroporphyrinogen-III synthase [Alphaproteobacteria bacterium]